MRVLLALAVLAVAAIGGVLASSACVIDARDTDAGAVDAEAAAPEIVDASAGDAEASVELDCGCCNEAVLPGLPGCDGKIAFAFPSGDCKVACPGAVAYAICAGECYTSCGCEVPAGFTLFDAGFVVTVDAGEAGRDAGDGGVGDAGGQ